MKSKEEIIQDYKKIINFVLKKMNLSYRHDELFDLGMIGFVKGVNSYDKSRGTYMTYLYDCIRNEIIRQIDYENRPKRQIEIVSYNTMISEDTELIDLLGYDIDYSEQVYFDELIKKILIFSSEHLTERQEEIFKYIYGIEGYPKLSFEEIAKIYKTSRQAIWDSHTRILNKLKKHLRSEK